MEVFVARIAPGFINGIEFPEDALLDLHVLEHRLDHDVRLRDGRVIECRRDELHACFDIGLGHAALFHGAAVVATDGRKATIKRLLLHLKQGDRDASVHEVDRTAAHGAGADHGGFRDRSWQSRLRDIGNLGCRALAEEDVAQRP